MSFLRHSEALAESFECQTEVSFMIEALTARSQIARAFPSLAHVSRCVGLESLAP
jgi:hypothetical protein